MCACGCNHLLWSGYPYMPAESHCSIVWPEPRPHRSEQLLQTHKRTHTKYMHTHVYTQTPAQDKCKKDKNKSKQMVNVRCFIPN